MHRFMILGLWRVLRLYSPSESVYMIIKHPEGASNSKLRVIRCVQGRLFNTLVPLPSVPVNREQRGQPSPVRSLHKQYGCEDI